ncbi:Low temperature viability protein Ltv1 [Babesia duncani]|uniref:Low temperature viability protein Ltv1 n=1 Tax=Babesia duncani TaxID=323732 RepID=A0AAD9UPU2_9APIC|nr:Low temperature viability protein Ltv1 [Babesia duncani]
MLIRVLTRALGNLCCRDAATCFLCCAHRIKALLPIPSDYEPIASLCLFSGLHDHPPFNLLIEVHNIRGNFIRKSASVEFTTSNTSSTPISLPRDNSGILENLGSRASLEIKQCDSVLRVNVFTKRIFVRSEIAFCDIDVKRDILDANYPKMARFDLVYENAKVGSIQVSFFPVGATGSVADSIVYQQALLCIHEYQTRGYCIDINLDNMDLLLERERLALVALALEGNLVSKQDYASQMYYFKPILQDDKWYWQFWGSITDCSSAHPPVGSIPIFSISTILAHPTDYTAFYIKYYTKTEYFELIFKTVGRSRDIWTDALYMFVDLNRKMREIPPEFLANVDPLDFGIHDKLTESQRNLLIDEIYGDESIFNTLAKPISKTEEQQNIDDEQLDEDCYFPKDGYDYEQHLATINPQYFIPAPTLVENEVHAFAHHNIESHFDFPEISERSKDPEVQEVVALLHHDTSDHESLDDDFVMQAMDDLNIANEIDSSSILWGDYKPVHKVQFEPLDSGNVTSDDDAEDSGDGNMETNGDKGNDSNGSKEPPDALGESLEGFYRKGRETHDRRSKESMSALNPSGNFILKINISDRTINVQQILEAVASDDSQSAFEYDQESETSSDSWYVSNKSSLYSRDVETILTTCTNATNHPRRISALVQRPEKKKPAPKPMEKKINAESDKEVIILPSITLVRNRKETPEEKRERKAAVKQAKQIMTEIKRQYKLTLKEGKKAAAQEMSRGSYDISNGVRYLKL